MKTMSFLNYTYYTFLPVIFLNACFYIVDLHPIFYPYACDLIAYESGWSKCWDYYSIQELELEWFNGTFRFFNSYYNLETIDSEGIMFLCDRTSLIKILPKDAI